MSNDEKKSQELQKQSATEIMSPFEEMEHWMEGFFPQWWKRRWGNMGRESLGKIMQEFSAPSVDVIDRDKEILVRVEAPGINKDDLDISVSDNTLTIKGSTKKEEKEEEKGVYYRREISTRDINHVLGLPCDVEPDQAKATFKDGMLEITLTKKENTKRHKLTID
jgi:HSP20 family protein